MSWEDRIHHHDKGRWTEEFFVLAELEIGNPGVFEGLASNDELLRTHVFQFLQKHTRVGVVSFIDCWRIWRESHICVKE